MLHQNAVVVAQLRVSKPSAAIAEAVTERVQRAPSNSLPVRFNTSKDRMGLLENRTILQGGHAASG